MQYLVTANILRNFEVTHPSGDISMEASFTTVYVPRHFDLLFKKDGDEVNIPVESK